MYGWNVHVQCKCTCITQFYGFCEFCGVTYPSSCKTYMVMYLPVHV